MNLGELLTELRENLLHDRSDQVSGESDQLWSDETLVRYINEAQRRFARRSLVIRDSTTSAVTQVTLATGTTTYTLHQSVLGILSAKFGTDRVDLSRAGHAAFDAYRQPDTTYFDPALIASLPPGRPIAYSTDEAMGEDDNGAMGAPVLRVYPAPTSDYNGNIIYLRVVRLPIERLTVVNTASVPEIPEDHHLEMLDWAAYLALRIVDVDAGWSARAQEFATSFEAHVVAAKASVMRKTFTPLQWGFGRNGFAWER